MESGSEDEARQDTSTAPKKHSNAVIDAVVACLGSIVDKEQERIGQSNNFNCSM